MLPDMVAVKVEEVVVKSHIAYAIKLKLTVKVEITATVAVAKLVA